MRVWGLGLVELGLGVSLIGVIRVLSSKVRSMLRFHVEGAQTVDQSLALRGD